MFQLRRLLTRYRSFILPIILCFISVVLLLFIVLPATETTLQQFQQVSTLKSEVETLQKKQKILNGIDQSTLQQNVQLTTSAIPVDKSLPTILSTMEGIGNQSGVSIKLLDLQAPGSLATQTAQAQQQSIAEQEIGAYTLPFTISLTGSLDQIKSLLSLSNSVRRMVHARSFSLDFSAGDQLSTDISFSAFYAPVPNQQDEELEDLQSNDQDVLNQIQQYPDLSVVNAANSGTSPVPLQVKDNPFSLGQ